MTGTSAVTVGQPRPDPSGSGSATRVLICDDRAGRAMVTAITAHHPRATDIRCVSDGFALVDAFAERPADVVLIGVHGGTTGGVHALDLLLGLYPTAQVIVFGSARDANLLCAGITRGARGLMLWNPKGGEPLGAGTAERPPSNTGRRRLTDRELQVLEGMTRGRSNSEIGRELYVSEDTIKTHAHRLYHKLGARDRAHAVALGLRDHHLDTTHT